jgi:hypothetical protein
LTVDIEIVRITDKTLLSHTKKGTKAAHALIVKNKAKKVCDFFFFCFLFCDLSRRLVCLSATAPMRLLSIATAPSIITLIHICLIASIEIASNCVWRRAFLTTYRFVA